MNKLLSVLKYISFLGVSVFLMWYALRELDFERMWAEFKHANYFWIIVSLVMGVVAYVSRAYRWQLQIKPTGYQPSLANTYHAMMIGYLANLVLPRMGEVVRCSVLKRTDNLPVNTGFGTVIAERFIDMLMLLGALGLTLLFEFDRLRDFFFSSFTEKYNSVEQGLSTLYVFGSLLLAGVVAVAVLILLFLNKLRRNSYFIRVVSFIKGMLQGIFSITKVDKQFAFWSHSVFVWVMFYFMSLVVLYALPATSGLSFSAGLSVLVIGSLGMAAPVQGGIGVYHLAVQTTLLLYGVPKEAGMAYALLAHTSQTLLVVLMGVLSFMATMLRPRTSAVAQAVDAKAQTHELKG
ncbi:lysylphosphatidylglycerol synthase transmembrane domain-containing protein [Botryobacter ruber]|uniref:lysylphosphatidylglycerol synthase transmembrane domain-containing protein n=1 Tax=Botryobacter ruber TaxID=2171629 RepID=UPI000E0A15C9|nr:lysylphosphatidylglycerol synthase transmembrane domain-containing protein [Botryobacter ruber]